MGIELKPLCQFVFGCKDLGVYQRLWVAHVSHWRLVHSTGQFLGNGKNGIWSNLPAESVHFTPLYRLERAVNLPYSVMKYKLTISVPPVVPYTGILINYERVDTQYLQLSSQSQSTLARTCMILLVSY